MHLSAVLVPLLLLLPQSTQRDGWLGVYLASAAHAEVAEVIPGSPAAKADLRVGDRFLAVGDVKTDNPVEFVNAIRGHKAGQRVLLTIRRGTQKLRIEVALEKRPPDDQIPPMGQRPGERPPEPPPAPDVEPKLPQAGGKPFIGVGLRETDAGLEITRVIDGSPAEKARLRVGDRLTRVGDQGVKTLEQLGKLLAKHRPGDKLPVQARGEAGVTLAVIVLGTMPDVGVEVVPVTPVDPAPPAKDLDAALDRAEKKLRELESELKELVQHAKALDELEALGGEVRALRKLLEDLRSRG